MNKTEVIAKVSEGTGIAPEICGKALEALESVSGSILIGRMKGEKLDQSAAVGEIARRTGISETDCKAILSSFEQTFGDALSDKFRLFKK